MSALIRVQLSAQSVQVQPGGHSDVTVTVQNLSEIVDRYRIAVEGIDASWLALSREELALFPKEQDEVLLTLRPPSGSEAHAGHKGIQVQVVSQDNPSERTNVTLDLEVLPVPALEVTLRPQRQSGMTEGVFRVQLRNQGNAGLTVEFEAVDPEEALLYAFSPSLAVVPAGQEQSVQLKVQAKLSLPREQPRPYSFTVTARPQEAAKLACRVQGEWIQTPPSFDLALSPQRQSSPKEGRFSVQVSNRGSVELAVQLEAADSGQRCLYLFDPRQVVVPAGQERQATLRLRPNAAPPGAQSQTYAFTVTARVAAAPTLTRQVQGEWEQVPPSFEMTLHPAGQSNPSEADFRVQLRNPGDSDLTVQMEAGDPQGLCRYIFDASQVTVPAGQERGVQLRVRSTTPPAAAAGRVILFTVTARLAEAPALTRQAQGEWRQTTLAPPAAPVRPAAAKPPRFWATVFVMLFGEGVALAASFGLALALDTSAEIWMLLWALGIIPVAFVAAKVWRGEKFAPFLVVMLVGQAATIPIGIFVANQVDSSEGDLGLPPLLVALVIWLAGLVVTVMLARRVSRPQE